MKSIIELELELSQAKLDKMTSTVKQLGTKLKKANEECNDLYGEKEYYKEKYFQLDGALGKLTLTANEAHSRALNDNSWFDLRAKHFVGSKFDK